MPKESQVRLQRAAEPAAARPSEVLERLRKLIEEGHFPPGSKVPPERSLAAQLGVGRPAVREAIKALNVLEVIESRQGAGTFVKSREPLAVRWPSLPLPGSVKFGVLDLLEVRKMIEPRAAWVAATRASERHLLDIEAARQHLEQHDRDWRLIARLDYELHAAIVRGAENPVLELSHRFLALHAMENRALAARFSPNIDRMRREHNAVVEAILKRQADAAESAMMEHLNSLGLDFIAEASR